MKMKSVVRPSFLLLLLLLLDARMSSLGGVWACGPEELVQGCRIVERGCVCGLGCQTTFRYSTRRQCQAALEDSAPAWGTAGENERWGSSPPFHVRNARETPYQPTEGVPVLHSIIPRKERRENLPSFLGRNKDPPSYQSGE